MLGPSTRQFHLLAYDSEVLNPGGPMSPFANSQELESKLQSLLVEKIGGSDEVDFDSLSSNFLVYHEFHRLLAAADLVDRIRAIRQSAPETFIAQLNKLNRELPSLRVVSYLDPKDSPEVKLAKMAAEMSLSPGDTAQLQQVFREYAAVLESVDAQAVQFDESEERLIAEVTDDEVGQFVRDFVDSGQWLNPTALLLPAPDSLVSAVDTPGPLFQQWARFFYEESRFETAIERFERAHQPFWADVARVFLFQAKLIHSIGKGDDFIGQNALAISEVMDRIEAQQNPPVLADAQELLLLTLGSLRLTLGVCLVLKDAERRHHLERAAEIYSGLGNAMFKPIAAVALWLRAQSAQGLEREELEAEALARVSDWMAESALEKEPIARMGAMGGLAALPPMWRLSKGDFKGAIEAASMAKSLARGFTAATKEHFLPLVEEIQREQAKGDEEDRAIASKLLDLAITTTQSATALETVSELTVIEAKAKLAESHGEYDRAGRLFQEAARLQSGVTAQFRAIITSFLDLGGEARQWEEGYQHQARAAYFQGMADLNRGDQSLMQGSYSTANENYLSAREWFGSAVGLWEREIDRIAQAPQQAKDKARRELSVCKSRMRYCDARTEMAAAEQQASLDHAWEAAKHFEEAWGIFTEMTTGDLLKEEDRNLTLLKASADFCKGRYLLETCRDARDMLEETVNEGAALLDASSRRFRQAGEMRWADYVQAMRLEYEAVIRLSFASKSRVNTESQREIARRILQEAAAIFRQLGATEHASDLEYRARADSSVGWRPSIVLALPKPLDTAVDSNPQTQILDAHVAPSRVEDNTQSELRELQQKVIALTTRLDDLEIAAVEARST